MKKSIALMIAYIMLQSATILSCHSPTKNTINAQENITERNKDLSITNQNYLNDIEQFRIEKGKKIELNSQNITVFKSKNVIDNEKSEADYRHSIFELELQNSYMKMKLDEYEPEGKKNWENFKAEFTRQMDELDKEFTDFIEAI